jgi:hypothetical protein
VAPPPRPHPNEVERAFRAVALGMLLGFAVALAARRRR